MWQHYERTFFKTQIAIGLVTCAVFARSHLISVTMVFFFTMQVGALVGAAWAHRIRRTLGRQL